MRLLGPILEPSQASAPGTQNLSNGAWSPARTRASRPAQQPAPPRPYRILRSIVFITVLQLIVHVCSPLPRCDPLSIFLLPVACETSVVDAAANRLSPHLVSTAPLNCLFCVVRCCCLPYWLIRYISYCFTARTCVACCWLSLPSHYGPRDLVATPPAIMYAYELRFFGLAQVRARHGRHPRGARSLPMGCLRFGLYV